MIYEYIIRELSVDDRHETAARLEEQLNAFGKDGWELLSVNPVPNSWSSRFVFKRLKANQPVCKVVDVTSIGDTTTCATKSKL